MEILLVTYSYALSRLFLPAFIGLLQKGGLKGTTYKGPRIAVGAGLALLFINNIVLVTTVPLFLAQWKQESIVLMFFLSSVGLVGLLDDTIGSKEIKGLKGHFGGFFKRGEISTGLIKAIGSGVSAFFVSYYINDIFCVFVLDALLLTVSINILNLLDLRPGRAGKFYLFIMIFTQVYGNRGDHFLLNLPLLGALIAYLPYDLGGKTMLGDVGSNTLGAASGLALVWHLSYRAKAVLLLLFLLLQIFCEFHSLTGVIEAVPVLEYLDRLGTPK